MSIVARVLGDDLHKDALREEGKSNLDEQVEKLESSLVESKKEILKLIQDDCVDFLPEALHDAQELAKKVNQLDDRVNREVDILRRQLDANKSLGSDKDINVLKQKLSDVEECISSLSGLSNIADLLQESEFVSPDTQPLQLAYLLQKISLALDDLSDLDTHDGSSNIMDARIVPSLKRELILRKEMLVYNMVEWWNESFKTETLDNGRTIMMTVQQPLIVSDANDRLTAMKLTGCLDRKLEQFAKAFLSGFLRPVIHKKCSLQNLKAETVNDSSRRMKEYLVVEMEKLKGDNEDGDGSSSSSSSSSGNNHLRTPIQKASDMLQTISDILDRFNSITASFTSNKTQSNSEADSFLKILSPFVQKDFLKLMTDEILKPAIPFEIGDSPEFDKLVEQAKSLVESWQSMGLLNDDDNSLDQFSRSKEHLFIERRCQKILTDGRALVMADLHSWVDVGVPKDPDELIENLDKLIKENCTQRPANLPEKGKETDKDLWNVKYETQNRLPSVLKFPRCKVSQSVVDLVNLLETTLDEACHSDQSDIVWRLFETSRNLLELYTDLSAVYHRDNLKNIPQFAAAFYNNCYYVSHRVMTLGWEYSQKLNPKMSLPQGSLRVNYVDFIPRLRLMASECMEAQLTSRKALMDDLLKETKGFANIIDNKRGNDCTRAMKGCVLQLQQISRVWHQVLTVPVYNLSMASLVNYFLNFVTNSLLKLEDISADDSDFMANLMANALEPIEDIFDMDKKGSEVSTHSEAAYFRYRETLNCLQGSLMSINERWASGKGPLATYMTPLEVKSLIRALFQNTERRATILSSIK